MSPPDLLRQPSEQTAQPPHSEPCLSPQSGFPARASKQKIRLLHRKPVLPQPNQKVLQLHSMRLFPKLRTKESGQCLFHILNTASFPVRSPLRKAPGQAGRHHNRCYCREQGQNQRHALPVFTAKSSHKSRRNYYDSQHTPRVAGMKAAFVIRYRSIFILIAPSSYLSFILSY